MSNITVSNTDITRGNILPPVILITCGNITVSNTDITRGNILPPVILITCGNIARATSRCEILRESSI